MISALNHITLPVSDLWRFFLFYTDTLCLRLRPDGRAARTCPPKACGDA